ncbi:hypothetical protein, partial [Streptomyces sp. 1222.5]|uniref:hypothetical protein n=1 Tax=Streptomyces sp. 1222.5 TaxID=1881026 RepID=UPI003F4A3B9A
MPESQDGKGGYTGGLSTTQRNLRPLFAYLADAAPAPVKKSPTKPAERRPTPSREPQHSPRVMRRQAENL